ncbi:hypothetical protein NRB56_53370 [Nocardia sp. RB56]|uniref:Uncharacterized protein n=1 Tax=Nocardia aurantia TaxID=2585199 RepID=A0A7K0DY04_9NOCA|nr:hypothetical protein [Nocardia aurantia]
MFGSLSPQRARVLLVVAARSSSFTMVAIVIVVIGTLLAADSGLTGVSGAIAAGWLEVHQVPLVVGHTELGVLPLLPTALVLWLTMRDSARAVETDCTRADLGWIVAAALAGPLLITAVCLAVAEDATAAVALQPPHTLTAFGWVAGLHLVAAAVGIAGRWFSFPRPRRELMAALPGWALPGARVGLRSVWRLLVASAAVTLVSFLANWSRVGDTYHAAGNTAGALGLTGLSLAYLPNVVIDAACVLLGANVNVGVGSLDLFGITGGPMPALPVLAAVPPGPAAGWWPVLLLIPIVVGVLAGVDCARVIWDASRFELGFDRATAPWTTLTAAGVAALLLTLLAALAGGVAGTFGTIGAGTLLSAGLAFAWFAVAGYAGMVVARRFGLAPASRPADDFSNFEHAYDDGYRMHDGPDLEVEVDGELLEEGLPLDDEAAGDEYDDYADDGYDDDGYDDEDDGYADDHDPAEPGSARYEDDETGYHEAEFEDDDEFGTDGRPVVVHPARPDDADEILDAEVVETDLPDEDGRGAR